MKKLFHTALLFAAAAVFLCGCSDVIDTEYFGDVFDEALEQTETYPAETTAMTAEITTTAAETTTTAAETTTTAAETIPAETEAEDSDTEYTYSFRNDRYLREHFEKHGGEFEFDTEQEYVEGANSVIFSADALHKTEAEDGDDIYYVEETNEFVVVSKDGYIRTYFKPSRGIAYYYAQ